MENEHITWIDIAKGMAIFLVVFGHLLYQAPYPIINKIIYSFHMPLFFIISGFLFHYSSKLTLFENVRKKFLRLIVPTFFFMIIGVIMYLLTESNYTFKDVFLLFIFWDGLCPFNSPCWFFIVLFEVYLLSYILKLHKYSLIELLLMSILVFILGYLIYSNYIFLPFGLDRCIVAFGFFIVGMILKKVCDYFKTSKYSYILFVIVSTLSMILWIYFCCDNSKVSFYSFSFGTYYKFIISGIFGSIVFCSVAFLLSEFKCSKAFILISNTSIFLIGTHFVLEHYYKIIMNNLKLFYTEKYLLISLVFSIILVLIYIPICSFLDKKVPFLTGKSTLNKS